MASSVCIFWVCYEVPAWEIGGRAGIREGVEGVDDDAVCFRISS